MRKIESCTEEVSPELDSHMDVIRCIKLSEFWLIYNSFVSQMNNNGLNRINSLGLKEDYPLSRRLSKQNLKTSFKNFKHEQ